MWFKRIPVGLQFNLFMSTYSGLITYITHYVICHIWQKLFRWKFALMVNAYIVLILSYILHFTVYAFIVQAIRRDGENLLLVKAKSFTEVCGPHRITAVTLSSSICPGGPYGDRHTERVFSWWQIISMAVSHFRVLFNFFFWHSDTRGWCTHNL